MALVAVIRARRYEYSDQWRRCSAGSKPMWGVGALQKAEGWHTELGQVSLVVDFGVSL